MKPTLKDAYQLLHQGSLTLAKVERNGIKIDTDYLNKAIERTDGKIKTLEAELREDKVYSVWKKRFGAKATLNNPAQLATIFFEELGYEHKGETKSSTKESRKYKADTSVFEGIEHPFLRKYRESRKWKTARNTFMAGILRETTPEGFLHAGYHLNTAITYRSSSSKPNFQNFPVRDQELSKEIRSAFIPRTDGRCLVEIDFSGAEVRVAVCYNKDPVLRDYILDKSKDMHRDMAAQCYMIKPEQVSKQARYCAKNMFVFPEFYGSYYIDCCQNLWEALTRYNLETTEGVPIIKHLAKKGIKTLGDCKPHDRPRSGTFEKHIAAVERDFWERRFKVYAKWKKSWYQAYLERGCFDTLTGFRCSGIMKRNDAINYPVQGSSFHCLLWCLIQLQEQIEKKRMKSLLVGQIHDSILADVPMRELDDYIELTVKIIQKWLPKHWKWLIVPMEAEVDVSPQGASWYEKEPYEVTA